jgi:putative Ca2+/H+ antiporter (TMEM165/GDT1 family)
VDLKSLAAVFGTVLLAELGDKTQLATLLYATRNPQDRWLVFVAAAGALVVAAALAVLAGGFVSQHLNTKVLARLAGVAFILIGAWTLWRA